MPSLSQFPPDRLSKTLESLHAGVAQGWIELDAFMTWGRSWWTTLFAPYMGKPYLALWYCLPEVQRGELLELLVDCGNNLPTKHERALVRRLPCDAVPVLIDLTSCAADPVWRLAPWSRNEGA